MKDLIHRLRAFAGRRSCPSISEVRGMASEAATTIEELQAEVDRLKSKSYNEPMTMRK